MIMPTREMEPLTLKLRRRREKSTSRPTMKRKRTRPRFATRLMKGTEGAGKTEEVKPGMRPEEGERGWSRGREGQ
jgi:hypothetical protein